MFADCVPSVDDRANEKTVAKSTGNAEPKMVFINALFLLRFMKQAIRDSAFRALMT